MTPPHFMAVRGSRSGPLRPRLALLWTQFHDMTAETNRGHPMRFFYFSLLAILGFGAVALAVPNAGLIVVLYLRPVGGLLVVGVMTGFVYLLAGLPWVLMRNRLGFGVSVAALAAVAFGPSVFAMFEARLIDQSPGSQHEVQNVRIDTVRVVDLVEDSRSPRCQALCAGLLAEGGIEAVRVFQSKRQTKRVYTRDEVTGALQWASETMPSYAQDGFPPADLTVETTKDHGAKGRSLLVDVDSVTRYTVRAGGFSRVTPGALLAQSASLDYNRPVWPTLFAPVTHGLVSGGNDGGIALVRTRAWKDSAGHVAAMVATLHSAGLSVSLAAR